MIRAAAASIAKPVRHRATLTPAIQMTANTMATTRADFLVLLPIVHALLAV